MGEHRGVTETVGEVRLVVPACPPAWREDLARALAPVLDTPVETLLSRLDGDPPFVVMQRVPTTRMAEIETVLQAQQIRGSWEEVETLGGALRDRRLVLIAFAVCLASVAFTFMTPWSFHQPTFGAVPKTEMPAPVRPPYDLDDFDEHALRRKMADRRAVRDSIFDSQLVPGADQCVVSSTSRAPAITCARTIDTCAAQRAWIEALMSHTEMLRIAILREPVTGFELWSLRSPKEVTEHLCRSEIWLFSVWDDAR